MEVPDFPILPISNKADLLLYFEGLQIYINYLQYEFHLNFYRIIAIEH